MITAAIALLAAQSVSALHVRTITVPLAPAVASGVEVLTFDPTLRLPRTQPRPGVRPAQGPYGRIRPSVLEMVSQMRPDPEFAEMDANGDGVVDRAEHAEWRRRSAEDASFRLLGYRKTDRGAPCAALRAISGASETR